MIRYAALALAGVFLWGCDEPKSIFDGQRRSTNIEDHRPDATLYGDEVRVRLYRGMGGKLTDHATWHFGYEARKLCGIRFYVESGNQTDRGAFGPTVRNARLVVFVGTSLGGYKAREHAAAFAPQHARLLLVDTVPWTKPIPANVGRDHVVWRNTAPFQLGGGKPQGTVNDRPIFATHGWTIHRPQTRKEVAEEICRGITHPSKRRK